MSDLHTRLEFATQLAYQAGEIMLKHFQAGVAKEDKADGTPVTVADKAINTLVIKAVRQQFPNDGVLAEEESFTKDAPEYLWVCDPINGTIPYVFGLPVSKFSLALVKDGKSVIGVIYDPFMKRLYHAIKNKGAFVNNTKLSVSNAKTLKEGKYLSFANHTVPLYDAGELAREVNRRKLWNLILLCFTAEATLVASGQTIGCVMGYSTAHDLAAVKVIVEEAGGKVTDLLGNEQRYDRPINGGIISNGLVHQELVGLVQSFLRR